LVYRATFYGSVCHCDPQKFLRALVERLSDTVCYAAKWLKSSVEKLFGKSEWVPNWGYESGQDGSKESRSAGLAVLRHPLWSTVGVPAGLVIIVGFLAMLQGAAGLVVAFLGGGWGMGILSVLGILFGLVLVINPLIGVAALPFILGIFMLIGGVGAVVQAFRMRREAPAEQQPRRVR
jgi:hypothetical protein